MEDTAQYNRLYRPHVPLFTVKHLIYTIVTIAKQLKHV